MVLVMLIQMSLNNMKAIILVAGYARRLYPLTDNQPKPLLVVGGKSIPDHIVEKMEKIQATMSN